MITPDPVDRKRIDAEVVLVLLALAADAVRQGDLDGAELALGEAVARVRRAKDGVQP